MIRRAACGAVAVVVVAGCGAATGRHPQATSSSSPAAAAGPVQGTSSPIGTEQAPTTIVDVDRLPRGVAPTASFDVTKHVLTVDGTATPVPNREPVSSVVRYGDDWVLLGADGLWRISQGTARLVTKGRGNGTDLPAPDLDAIGYAWNGEDDGSEPVEIALSVVDATSGAVRERRQVTAAGGSGPTAVDLLAVGRTSALLVTEDRVAEWRYGQKRLRTVLRTPQGRVASLSPDGDHLIAWDSGSKGYALGSLRGGPTRALGDGQEPRGFSPDGRYLLVGTSHDTDERGYDSYDLPLTVYDVTTGEPVRAFSGTGFGWDQQAVWAGDDAFYVQARPPRSDVAEGLPITWLRCTVAGRCERVAPTVTANSGQTPDGLLVVGG